MLAFVSRFALLGGGLAFSIDNQSEVFDHVISHDSYYLTTWLGGKMHACSGIAHDDSDVPIYILLLLFTSRFIHVVKFGGGGYIVC